MDNNFYQKNQFEVINNHISRSAHLTPNFTNPEYFFVFLVFFPDISFELISKYTQNANITPLY